MAMAMRGEELIVAHLDASDPDLSADIQLTGVSLSGEQRAFGGFDTADAPWSDGLSLLVSPDTSKLIVAYQSTVEGSLPRASARRFDCVP
jgi:hypothetical protein